MKKTIILNSGHSKTDSGSPTIYGNETDFNMAIRDLVVPKLEARGFKVEQVPDDLNLTDSIAWVNARVRNIDDGLALSLHCNCCGGDGAETYYFGHNQKSKDIATKLLEGYCQETGLPKSNGGVRSDTTGRWGELGWIRKTNCWAVLIEMIYLDNKDNVDFFNGNKEKVAKGIVRGVCNIYGLEYNIDNPPELAPDKMAEIKRLAQKIISLTS